MALQDWLTAVGVTHVAMESTGMYWKAPYYMLEDEFEVMLVNAAHVKHVPGRKTDVIDDQWTAEILSYGLLRPSFVPPRPFSELRDLTRYRKGVDPSADQRSQPPAQYARRSAGRAGDGRHRCNGSKAGR